MEAEKQFTLFQENYHKLLKEIQKVIVGQEDIIRQILICLFTHGHILLEGVPGLGKTKLIKSLSKVLNMNFSRIQFTPDLMPADILGTNIFMNGAQGGKSFQFIKGPVFANIILADEINRATPKTQSALLEAMQEGYVTISQGRNINWKTPFWYWLLKIL
jgi:MoxR-like ATPase